MGRPGSSPRVRGKRKLAGRPIQHVRIIPARAGQTRRFFHVIIRCTDHPRACGANHRRRRQQGQEGGSSPRVRGKLRRAVPMQSGLRIIPARAGQTSRSSVRTSCFPDHPRACGANELMATTLKQFNGSSPRVRGKRLAVADRLLTNRIIPARAGQTKTLLPTFCPHSDHPRACGANCPAGKSRGCVYGSSPRVRGKRTPNNAAISCGRIIPARAGQTDGAVRPPRRCPDHPRACGANGHTVVQQFFVIGSSPRVRGKPVQRGVHQRVSRIIPARAGQTPRPSVRLPLPPDHPRACGANQPVRRDDGLRPGSSPRVRGKPHAVSGFAFASRIIPARAGQTKSVPWMHPPMPDHPRACGANSPILCENS